MNGNTALIEACAGGHVETAGLLLDHRANVDHQNNVSSQIILYYDNLKCILQNGETALNLACYKEESETVSLLLKAGAKTDIQEEVAIVQ